MAIYEQELDAPALSSLPVREVIQVPDDYLVQVAGGESTDVDDVHTLEALWAGEPKVNARIDNIYGREYIVDKVQRPPHWGEDQRPAEEQQREFELGFDGILKALIYRDATGIEVTEQSGIVATAIANLRMPEGWARKWRVEDQWLPEGPIDLNEAISLGAKVSMRYELLTNPPVDIGRIATVSSLRSV
jgi:hypothetical protein